MNRVEFVKGTIGSLEQESYELLTNALIGEYIKFEFIEGDDITPVVFKEKLCDYFEKLELKTGKPFEKQIDIYVKDLDSIVEDRIEKTPQLKKKDQKPVEVPLARKYYEKALEEREKYT